MGELTTAIYARVQALCESGDALAKEGDYSSALTRYWEAWDLLPKPKTEWEAATWILAAVGDANFMEADW